MKKRKNRILFTVAVLLLMMTACTDAKQEPLSEEARKICGSWAYNHDTETAVAIFKTNGKAEYKDKDYRFTCDSTYIYLTDKEGSGLQLRYVMDEKGMYLYDNKTYDFCGEGTADGLVGSWESAKDSWSFVFSKEGEFVEDGCFIGKYTVDPGNSTFILDYYENFEDTLCYFHVEENQLSIEYPWRVVIMDS